MADMIDFIFTLTTRYEQWHNDRTFNVLEYEGNLEIVIDSTVFFSDPYFVVLEFLADAFRWVNGQTKDMTYNCIETEETR